MDKNINPKRVRTAPIAGGMGDNVGMAALLRELGRYQEKLDKAHRIIKHQRAKGHGPAIKAEAEKRVDLGAAVKSAMTDIMTEDDYGQVLYWRYVAKKLRILAEAGALEVERDAELAGLRKFMRKVNQVQSCAVSRFP
jgi:hypothetical protein